MTSGRPEIDLIGTGNNIKFYMARYEYTVEHLADMLCISKEAITSYRVGKKKPSLETLKAMVPLFHVDSLDDIIVWR